MSTKSVAYQIVYGNAFPAKYDGRCPYSPCTHGGFIRVGQLIEKGELGYGHAECVNMKAHMAEGDGADCGTTSEIMLRLTDDYHKVTCKKCLKKLVKEVQGKL
jgi:hypothetical protein